MDKTTKSRPTRRHVMIGFVAATAAPVPLLAAEIDPLMELIAGYRRQVERFNERRGMTNEEADAFGAETYDPFVDRLMTNPPHPTTRRGAIEALRLAHEEMEQMDGGFAFNLVTVALAYFDGEA